MQQSILLHYRFWKALSQSRHVVVNNVVQRCLTVKSDDDVTALPLSNVVSRPLLTFPLRALLLVVE